MEEKPVFIDCLFVPDDDTKAELARLTNSPSSGFETIRVRRKYDKNYYINFPDALQQRLTDKIQVAELLATAAQEIESMTPLKTEADYASAIKEYIADAISALPEAAQLDKDDVQSLLDRLHEKAASPKSAIAPRYTQVRDALTVMLEGLQKTLPGNVKEARQYALKQVPPFVYYTSYGNLDSEIYLPHVIENMERTDLVLGRRQKYAH